MDYIAEYKKLYDEEHNIYKEKMLEIIEDCNLQDLTLIYTLLAEEGYIE